MRTLRSKYLSDIPIDENNFKADFHILEKYQAFSAEILRLSLLGLTIYGFILTNTIFKKDKTNSILIDTILSENKNIFIYGSTSLIVSAVCALGHRYYSTDCMTHFIRGLRLRTKLSGLSRTKIFCKTRFETKALIQSENNSFESDLSKCRWLLIGSCISLITGIFFIIFGLSKILK